MNTGSTGSNEGFALLEDGKRHWLGDGCNPLCEAVVWMFEPVIDADRHNPLNCEQCLAILEANERARGVMCDPTLIDFTRAQQDYRLQRAIVGNNPHRTNFTQAQGV